MLVYSDGYRRIRYTGYRLLCKGRTPNYLPQVSIRVFEVTKVAPGLIGWFTHNCCAGSFCLPQNFINLVLAFRSMAQYAFSGGFYGNSGKLFDFRFKKQYQRKPALQIK